MGAGTSLQSQGSAGASGIRETKPVGNGFRLEQTWPSIQSLQGRRDVDNMRLRSIEFSRWSSSDYDFSGLQVTNNQGQTSELMGTKRYDFNTVNL